MRIHLNLSKNTKTVPFNYQYKLVGALHKWIGGNIFHDKLSLYSFSQLQRGEKTENGLNFSNGANWFISFYDNLMLKKIVLSIKKDPEACFGMNVKSITIQETPDFTNIEYFKVASPVFIKRTIDGKSKHYIYSDAESSELLTMTLQNKMKLADIEDDSLKIEFDKNYKNISTKLIDYKGIKNKASWCPVIIHGKPETKAFAWNVGVGNSTGIGFGALI